MLILNTVRQQVFEIDKEQPIGRPVTIEEILGNDFIQPRFNVALFSTLAVLALALATAGIYSVISYHVARRTQEIGIRVSLGAKAADVSRLILTLGTKLVATGLVIGVSLSWALARVLQTQVFEITDLSVSSMLVVVVVLAVTALTASYIPARRASRIDPIVALREN
jgi:ABC-type antimicrobial peptide transport system permease subunit